jgi:predicted enzyme related to lactoylglutathione lyase
MYWWTAATQKSCAISTRGFSDGTHARLYDAPAVRSKNGVTFLFVQDEDYVPPVWPEENGRQQKQMHFDFQVPNVPDAVQKAEALGAVKAKAQFGGTYFTTMLDPAGHPFCLCGKD